MPRAHSSRLALLEARVVAPNARPERKQHRHSSPPRPARLREKLGTEQCTMGRVINLDTDANFQCDQTMNAYENLQCRRGSTVTIGFGQCTPGAWLGRAAYVDCSWCIDPYMAMNIFCGSDGRSYDVEPYRSYDGVNRYDYNWIGYPWNGSYGLFHVSVAPGQSVTDYYVSNLGFGCNLYVYYSVSCSGTTCTPSMRNVSSGCNSSGRGRVLAPRWHCRSPGRSATGHRISAPH
jgi:hypothetical protein